MKRTISALAVLASSVAVQASGDYACVPVSNFDGQVSIRALCDASEFNKLNKKTYGLKLDETTGCVVSSENTDVNAQADAWQWVEDVKLRACVDDEAIAMVAEL